MWAQGEGLNREVPATVNGKYFGFLRPMATWFSLWASEIFGINFACLKKLKDFRKDFDFW